MIKNTLLRHIVFTLIGLSPIGYILLIWSSIKPIVPTHFGVSGPDAYGPKSELLEVVAIVSVISVLTYFLMQYLNKIDPKRVAKPQAPVFRTLSMGMVVFMAAINYIIIIASTRQANIINYALLPLVGLLIAFVGNYMPNLKPNYFAGIRIAWTLHSDYNWRKTHQLAGKIWFVCGLLFTAAALFLPAETVAQVLPYFIGIIVVVPIAYSYYIFRKEQANPGIGDGGNVE